jgi:hypothetical protein
VQSRNSTGFRRFAADASSEMSKPMLRWFLQGQIAAYERTSNGREATGRSAAMPEVRTADVSVADRVD